MAYATETDCRLHAPQAPGAEDFSGWITQADGLVDSKLRAFFDVPLTTVPQLITNIVSRLAAGRYLEAKYGAINQEPPAYAGNLISDAMDDLNEIIKDPSVLGVDRRDLTVEDLEDNPAVVSDHDSGMFNSMNPKDWG